MAEIPVRKAGIVLCGGQSSRMGAPKAWLPLGDETLLQRTVRIVREAVDIVFVAAAPAQSLPPLPADVRVVEDPQPFRGPLQGIATGLEHARRAGADVALVVATDLPLLSEPLIRYLFERLGAAGVAVPYIGERYHPLCAVYRVHPTADLAVQLLQRGETRPRMLYEQLDVVRISEEDLEEAGFSSEVLANVNTPEDYESVIRAFLRRRARAETEPSS